MRQVAFFAACIVAAQAVNLNAYKEGQQLYEDMLAESDAYAYDFDEQDDSGALMMSQAEAYDLDQVDGEADEDFFAELSMMSDSEIDGYSASDSESESDSASSSDADSSSEAESDDFDNSLSQVDVEAVSEGEGQGKGTISGRTELQTDDKMTIEAMSLLNEKTGVDTNLTNLHVNRWEAK